ncbi:uncharacterized protein LOC126741672 [Anthonomus grandis grandis]|uniref:uncharacterized protein LOC126741672 n=1 Tax=Anthonomus grandis grandis TaxID=2921223 RepID=UPI00216654B5|nr:uncharacterized protein LOC126741672 [Anthonomus grandis grandis]
MFTTRVCAVAAALLQYALLGVTGSNDIKNAKSIYDFSAKDIYGNDVSLEKYKGHVCIIVNVASECGLTNSNYEELNQLFEKYAGRGLRILGFPSNEFGGQEPGTNEDILKFAKSKGVQFDLFSKIQVNGENAHPLWKYLKSQQGGFLVDGIKWNFTKFLIDQHGQVVDRYAPTTSPSSIEKDLQKLFAQQEMKGEL